MRNYYYIREKISVKNGHSIFDDRLYAELNNIENFSIHRIDIDKNNNCILLDDKKIPAPTFISMLKDYGSVFVFSHFSVFKYLKHASNAVCINHDLPYWAYFKTGEIKGYLKGIALYLYITHFQKYSNFNFFISEVEHERSKLPEHSKGLIRVGCSPTSGPLKAKKRFLKEALLSGNYKWSLKRKSLHRSIQILDQSTLKLAAYNVCDVFEDICCDLNVSVSLNDNIEEDEFIRFGIISDSFVSGFKLKSLELIEKGCCLLTFCDLLQEFRHIVNSELFVRKVSSPTDINSTVEELIQNPISAEQFNQFRREITTYFSWKKSASIVHKKIENLFN